jgi:phospholipase C
MPRRVWLVGAVVLASLAVLVVLVNAHPSRGQEGPPGSSADQGEPTNWPIRHVVVIDQENHSFDNVLGDLCASVAAGTFVRDGLNQACDGVRTGKIHTGATINLPPADDIVPEIPHSVQSHDTSIDNGAMDGFDLLKHCGAADNYACYQQYSTGQSPNLTTFAKEFGVADRFFEFRWFSSWMSHTTMVSLDMDGFQGNIPKTTQSQTTGRGWGCDSFLDAKWSATGKAPWSQQPACIPDQAGNGPYRTSPVSYVPSLMDRMQAAGVSWKIFGSGGPSGGGAYGWTICPTFWSCLGHADQKANFKNAANFIKSAQDHTLPQVSIVTPLGKNSQHNTTSWTQGDNWLGTLIDAITSNGYWDTTSVFITYDDCGCFYDHVTPPQGLGLRNPMVIASPYAIPQFTDSTTAVQPYSMLAFIDHNFGLTPLTNGVAQAYDYSNSFNFTQQPLAGPRMTHTDISAAERARLAKLAPFEEDDLT